MRHKKVNKQVTNNINDINRKTTITFNLRNLSLLSFSVLYNPEVNQDSSKFGYEFLISMKPALKEKCIFVNIKINIIYGKEEKSKVGFIETLNEYQIGNNNYKLPINISELPKEFIAVIVGISISNTRGMLKVKSAGTILENCIIPIVDPNNFIQQKHN